MISRFGVCSHHWLCVLCWQVFEELLLDADWSVNAGMWMWLSCSSFFQQFFHCYCPVGFGKRADPTGDFIRYLLSYLCLLQIRYLSYLSLLNGLQVNNKTILSNIHVYSKYNLKKKKKEFWFFSEKIGIIMLVMHLRSEYFNLKSVWFYYHYKQTSKALFWEKTYSFNMRIPQFPKLLRISNIDQFFYAENYF